MAYVRTRLGRLFYEERGAEGAKTAIVLLHGLLFDGGMWNGQVAPLAALGRVVVIDGPGHGRSEPAPRFLLEDHADALFDAFGELGISRAVLLGLSWGGMVAIRMALQHPEHVAGLAVLDASAHPDTLANRLRYRAFIAMHRRVGFPRSLFDRELAPRLFSDRFATTHPEVLDAAYRRTMGFERAGLARAAIAVVIHGKDVRPLLGAIRAPTIVMCGSEDRSTPPSHSREIAQAIAGAELVVLDGLGHMSAIEDPGAVNASLLPFVQRCLR